MPRPVENPRSRHGFESNFNSALTMSINAVARVKFQMDLEKALFEQKLKVLNWHEAIEIKENKREVAQLREELLQLRAYALVARKTAFRKFDPYLRRREEILAQQQQDEEEEEMSKQTGTNQKVNKDFESKREKRKGRSNYTTAMRMMTQRLNEKGKEQVDADGRDGGGGDDDDDADSPEVGLIRAQHRRLSQAGNVFVTLQDIMENDTVLQEQSEAITLNRRKSLIPSLQQVEGDVEPVTNKVDRWMRTVPQCAKAITRFKRRKSLRKAKKESSDKSSIKPKKEKSQETKETSDSQPNLRRQSLLDGVGNLALIPEHTSDELHSTNDDAENDKDDNERGGNNNDSFNDRGSNREFFITAADSYDEMSKGAEFSGQKSISLSDLTLNFSRQKIENTHTIIDNSNMSKDNDTTDQLEIDSDIDHLGLRRLSTLSIFANPPRRSSLRSLVKDITNEESQNTGSQLTWRSMPTLKNIGNSEEAKPESDSAPPLRGLDRFRAAINAVNIQNQAAKKEGPNRLKNLAAAVILQDKGIGGTMPKSFLFSQNLMRHSTRRGRRSMDTPLEASHRRLCDVLIRPLEMPESVKKEKARQWEELMGRTEGAVHLKVQALREDTGLLSTKQLIREQSRRPAHTPREAVFPGSCRTTWAMKNYLKNQVAEVISAHRPENLRKKRSRSLVDKKVRSSCP